MLRITHIITDENVGGAGIQLAHLCRGLSKSFSVEIILPRGSSLIERLPREEVRITPFAFADPTRVTLKDICAFYRYFRATRPDIVHTHAALCARIGATCAGIGVRLSTRHCAVGTPAPLSAAKRALYNACTTLTIATAPTAAQDLLTEGIPPSRIHTVPNGTPPTRRSTQSERAALLDALRLQPTDIVLGCCGRLEHIKGQDVLLHAAGMLLPSLPHLRVLLVGDGSRRQALQTLAARLGITRIVRFVGYVDDVAPYQNLFTININPSRGTETSCLATSECMSLAIPTVASDFGGNRDMITEGVNGMHFRTDDARSLAHRLAHLLHERALLQCLGEGAQRVYLDRYTLASMINAYKSVYLSITNN